MPKKGSDRAGEGRSADLVDVGLERRGEEGCSHGGRPSGSFSKRSLGAGSESRRRVRESCHSAETAMSCSLGFSLLERLNYKNFFNFISIYAT